MAALDVSDPMESTRDRVVKYFQENFSCSELPMRYDALAGPFFDTSMVKMSGCCGGMDGDYPVWSAAPSTSMAAMLKPQKQRQFKKSDNAHDESETSIQFTPRVYVQRYQGVAEVLLEYQGALHKVVDFGCGDGSFIKRFLREPSGVKRLVGVDIDETELATAVKLLGPSFEDRKALPSALNVHGAVEMNPSKTLDLWQGSVLEPDDRLLDADAVVMIEVIEHLYEEDLPSLVRVLFAHIRPSLVVLTTPNADFNHFFHMAEGQFRHWDHKYEWTRKQFSDWCNCITAEYPDYSWDHRGLASHPDGIETSGCCSQMAIFTKRSPAASCLAGKLEDSDTTLPTKIQEALNGGEPVVDVSNEWMRSTDVGDALDRNPYILIAHIFYPTEEQLSLREHQLQGAVRAAIDDQVSTIPDSKLRWIFKKQGVDIGVEDLFQHPKVKALCHSLFQVSMVLQELNYYVSEESRSIFHVVHQEYSSSESSSSGPEWGQ